MHVIRCHFLVEFLYDGLVACVFFLVVCCFGGNVDLVWCSLIGQLVSLLKA